MARKYRPNILYLGARDRIYNEFNALSTKNNWHVTFFDGPPSSISWEKRNDLFILVPTDIGDLHSCLYYFITYKRFCPWVYAALIYDFFLEREKVEIIANKVGCKVLGTREIKRLREYIHFVEQELNKD